MKFLKNAYVTRVTRLVRYFAEKRVSLYASSACYFLGLSLFPMLVLLLGLLRYTGLGADTLLDALSALVPQPLLPLAKSMILSAYRNTSGALVSLSAVTALWSASRGVYSLLKGLCSIYERERYKGYWQLRTMSVGYTFALLVVLVLTLVLGVFGKELLTYGTLGSDSLFAVLDQVVDMGFFVLLFVLTGFFCLVYMFLPGKRSRFLETLPGGLMTTVGWLLFTQLYSVYATRFSGYANVYGSVYILALSMLWLYCCISLVFYGGALNRYLAQEK